MVKKILTAALVAVAMAGAGVDARRNGHRANRGAPKVRPAAYAKVQKRSRIKPRNHESFESVESTEELVQKKGPKPITKPGLNDENDLFVSVKAEAPKLGQDGAGQAPVLVEETPMLGQDGHGQAPILGQDGHGLPPMPPQDEDRPMYGQNGAGQYHGQAPMLGQDGHGQAPMPPQDEDRPMYGQNGAGQYRPPLSEGGRPMWGQIMQNMPGRWQEMMDMDMERVQPMLDEVKDRFPELFAKAKELVERSQLDLPEALQELMERGDEEQGAPIAEEARSQMRDFFKQMRQQLQEHMPEDEHQGPFGGIFGQGMHSMMGGGMMRPHMEGGFGGFGGGMMRGPHGGMEARMQNMPDDLKSQLEEFKATWQEGQEMPQDLRTALHEWRTAQWGDDPARQERWGEMRGQWDGERGEGHWGEMRERMGEWGERMGDWMSQMGGGDQQPWARWREHHGEEGRRPGMWGQTWGQDGAGRPPMPPIETEIEVEGPDMPQVEMIAALKEKVGLMMAKLKEASPGAAVEIKARVAEMREKIMKLMKSRWPEQPSQPTILPVMPRPPMPPMECPQCAPCEAQRPMQMDALKQAKQLLADMKSMAQAAQTMKPEEAADMLKNKGVYLEKRLASIAGSIDRATEQPQPIVAEEFPVGILPVLVPEVEAQPAPILSMGNPASIFCAKNGGKFQLRDDNVGFCVFQDGSECEEWAFMKKACMPGQSLQVPELVVAITNSQPEQQEETTTTQEPTTTTTQAPKPEEHHSALMERFMAKAKEAAEKAKQEIEKAKEEYAESNSQERVEERLEGAQNMMERIRNRFGR